MTNTNTTSTLLYRVSYVGRANHHRPGVRNYLRPVTDRGDAVTLAYKYAGYRNVDSDSVVIETLRCEVEASACLAAFSYGGVR